MKKLLISLILIFAICLAYGQIPPLAFNYSAVARNSQGNPIANSTIGIQISILKTTAIGAVQYSENHFVNTDAFGLFNLIVGAGAIQQGSMSSIDWSSDNFYIKVGMDANGGTNFLTMGTTQFLSVPYALHAKTADSVANGASAVHIQAGNNVTITGTGTSTDPYIVNSTATGSGSLLAPTVTTNNATNISNVFATLNSNVNPNSLLTNVSFEYGTTNLYGSTINATISNVSGNSSTPLSANLVGLNGGTLYHYRVKAQNAVDISYGNDLTFSTIVSTPPLAITNSASNINTLSATFNADVNPYGLQTNVSFEFGTTTTYGSSLNAIPNLVSGNSLTSVSKFWQLERNTTYHYRVKAQNADFTSYGNDITFTTPLTGPPIITGLSDTLFFDTPQQNKFSLSLNPNGLATSAYFEYGTTLSFGSNVAITPASNSGTSGLWLYTNAISLTSGITYYYRCVATNSAGTVYSDTYSFTYP